MTKLARGFTFTHHYFLDPDWVPGPGQRYIDAPKATMVVTRVTAHTIYYGFCGEGVKGKFATARHLFIARYCKDEVTA